MTERDSDVESGPALTLPLLEGSSVRLRRHRHFENENCARDAQWSAHGQYRETRTVD
jgi:hypothetical protein